MLSIQTQETKQSTTCEGVSFTIRKLSRIQRSLRDLPIFEERLKAENLSTRWWELQKEKEALCASDSEISAIDQQLSTLPDVSPEKKDLEATREKLCAANPSIAKVAAQMASVDNEYGLMVLAHMVPASIKAGLVSITGLEINGQPATPELLVTCATPEVNELLSEIYAECEAASGLTSTQKKNSQSPITSSEQMTGDSKSSTAVSAS